MSAAPIIDVPRGPFLAPVLGRVVRYCGARAEMDLDRLSDAVLVADAIAAKVWEFCLDGRVQIAIAVVDGRIALDVGPLLVGGADRLVASTNHPGVGSVLAALADRLEARNEIDGDHLHLELGRRRPD